MGEDLRIQAVCGFGCGSSLFLRIKIDKVLKENGITARTFCGDVGTAASTPCDVIFCSDEIAERLASRATVPVIRIALSSTAFLLFLWIIIVRVCESNSSSLPLIIFISSHEYNPFSITNMVKRRPYPRHI